MPYHLKRKENPAQGVARLVREQVEVAIGYLEQPGKDKGEVIHETRKCLKKSRAALLLLKKPLGKSYKSFANQLKRAAGQIAKARDSHVLVATLAVIKREQKIESIKGVENLLKKKRREVLKQLAAGSINKQIVQQLQDFLVGFEKGFDCKMEWTDLRSELKTTYRTGRKTFRKAREDVSPPLLHQWRKEVKKLWYQLQVLREIWPEMMENLAREAKLLGGLLGQYHDLIVLEETLLSEGVQFRKEVEKVLEAIENTKPSIRYAAFHIGNRLYADKPRAFASRIADYWDFYSEKKSG